MNAAVGLSAFDSVSQRTIPAAVLVTDARRVGLLAPVFVKDDQILRIDYALRRQSDPANLAASPVRLGYSILDNALGAIGAPIIVATMASFGVASGRYVRSLTVSRTAGAGAGIDVALTGSQRHIWPFIEIVGTDHATLIEILRVTEGGPTTVLEQAGLATNAAVLALGARTTQIEVRAQTRSATQRLGPTRSRIQWLHTYRNETGERGVFGIDPLRGIVDSSGKTLRPAIGPRYGGYSDVVLNVARQIVRGVRDRDGASFFSKLAGPTVDRLTRRAGVAQPAYGGYSSAISDEAGRVLYGLEREGGGFVCQGGAPTEACIAPGANGRPQVFAVSPNGCRQITFEEAGVGEAHAARPLTDLAGLVRYTALRAGGGSLHAGWNRSLADASQASVLVGILAYGQSLSIGWQAAGDIARAVLKTPPLPTGVLAFSETATPSVFGISPSGNYAVATPAGRLDYLTPAREAYVAQGGSTFRGETGWVAAAVLYRENALRSAASVVVSSWGVAGRAYSALKKGTQPYANLLGGVDALVAKAQALSLTPQVDWIPLVHGESNQTDTQAAYTASQDEWASDLNTDIKSKTGQSSDVLFTLTQIPVRYDNNNFNISAVALSQLECGLNNPRIICAGPRYALAYPDAVHTTSDEYLQQGGYHAKAISETKRTGIKFRPLHMTGAVLSGAVIVVDFYVPIAPLRVDIATVAPRPGYGFAAKQGATSLTIARVEISSAMQVKITLSTVPNGDPIKLGLGATGTGNPGTGTSCASNIRDSDTYANPANGRLMPNWACHQIIDVLAA